MIWIDVDKKGTKEEQRPEQGLLEAMNIPIIKWKVTTGGYEPLYKLLAAILDDDRAAFRVENNGKCWRVVLKCSEATHLK